MTNLLRALLLFGLVLVAADASQAQTAGSFGGSCRDGQACDEGICDSRRNICVPCGGEGQPVCRNASGGAYCSFPDYGYRPLQVGGRLQICVTNDTRDCGQIGLPACQRDDGPHCQYGVLIIAQGGQAVCGACGDFGQACCPATAVPCDYGSCQNGICLPDPDRKGQAKTSPVPDNPADTADMKQAILDAIAACRLSEARRLHERADPKADWYGQVSQALVTAVERENDVSAIYGRAKAIWAKAADDVARDDYTAATDAYRRATDLLWDARAKSGCPQTIAVINEALTMIDRANARTQPRVELDLVRNQIKGCNFDLAGQLLDSLPQQLPGRDAVQDLLNEALDRESRVMQVYGAAKEIHTIASDRLSARKFADAAEGFSDARDGFLKARQLTRCTDFRIKIDEAIAVTGRNLDTASSLAAAVAQNNAQSRNTGNASGGQKPPAPASSPHPCLDPNVPSNSSAAIYRQYYGGGGESFPVKGQFICGLWGDFTVLTGSELILNKCTRDGNRLSNCKETRRIAIEDVKQKDRFTEYLWKTKDGWQWVTVSKRK